MLDTSFYTTCIHTLDKAYGLMRAAEPDTVEQHMYRSACVKEFELILEQSAKLLRKTLRPFVGSNREVDKLPFKDLFRHAARYALIDDYASERWLAYRDLRNDTAHNYGAAFADDVVEALPQFISDSKGLLNAMNTNTPEL